MKAMQVEQRIQLIWPSLPESNNPGCEPAISGQSILDRALALRAAPPDWASVHREGTNPKYLGCGSDQASSQSKVATGINRFHGVLARHWSGQQKGECKPHIRLQPAATEP